jgi:hypothetical protein
MAMMAITTSNSIKVKPSGDGRREGLGAGEFMEIRFLRPQ